MEGNRDHRYSHVVWNLRQARTLDFGVSFAGINEPTALFEFLVGPYLDLMTPAGWDREGTVPSENKQVSMTGNARRRPKSA